MSSFWNFISGNKNPDPTSQDKSLFSGYWPFGQSKTEEKVVAAEPNVASKVDETPSTSAKGGGCRTNKKKKKKKGEKSRRSYKKKLVYRQGG